MRRESRSRGEGFGGVANPSPRGERGSWKRKCLKPVTPRGLVGLRNLALVRRGGGFSLGHYGACNESLTEPLCVVRLPCKNEPANWGLGISLCCAAAAAAPRPPMSSPAPRRPRKQEGR
eukprot:7072774-Pyramimonas_sp.AAC.1